MSATIHAVGNATLQGQAASYSFSKTLSTVDMVFRQEFKNVSTTFLEAFAIGTEAAGTVAGFSHAIIYNRDPDNTVLVECIASGVADYRFFLPVLPGTWLVLNGTGMKYTDTDHTTLLPFTLTSVQLRAVSTTVTWVQVIVYGTGS